MKKVILMIIVIIVILAGICLMGYFFGFFSTTLAVGTNIADSDITEFYYTYDRNYGEAYYQRYHFYIDNHEYWLFHETRESDEAGFLTEENATRTGTIQLTSGQWQDFLDHIHGGTVTKRQTDTSSGGRGPWVYLYWKKDAGRYQQYTFSSESKEQAFVKLCEEIIENPKCS